MLKHPISKHGFLNAADFFGITGVKKPIVPIMIKRHNINGVLIDPALTLLINPSNIDITMASKIQPTKVRKNFKYNSGHSIEYHHDELDTMSVNCTTAQFYSSNGLTPTNLKETMAYDNFQKLIALYRNNGKTYNIHHDGIIDTVGEIVIHSLKTNYFGVFEEFSYTQSSDKPYNFAFTWSFVISRTENY